LETQPVYYQSDAAIAGHLFCSFLALLLAPGDAEDSPPVRRRSWKLSGQPADRGRSGEVSPQQLTGSLPGNITHCCFWH
jgi:hypothetical protein